MLLYACVGVRTQAGALLPEDRVLLVGITSEPQACIARDGDALRSLFTLRFCVPMLTRLDRQVRSNSRPNTPDRALCCHRQSDA